MRDVFYTILIAWVLWRILASVNNARSKASAGGSRKPGETTIDHAPQQKKKMPDVEGEYVDYEEVK
jgi:hypothetical protein